MGGELARPVIAPGLLGSHEIFEIDWAVLLPDFPGAPEVRDTRLGADPRPGKHHRPAAGIQSAYCELDLH